MGRVFVFVHDVEKIIAEGKSEIELPEEVRFTDAALDLIKERKIAVKYVTAVDEFSDSASSNDETSVESASEQSEEVANDLVHTVATTFSEEELEEITERVIKRYKQLSQCRSEDHLEDNDSEPAVPEPGDDLIICRCEEITKGEIKEAIRNGMDTLGGIKRISRAGMGLCQGQTCERLICQILAQELGLQITDIEPVTARAPVRPVRLSVFANT
jgi:bacterioferritin-associated ferredoxin